MGDIVKKIIDCEPDPYWNDEPIPTGKNFILIKVDEDSAEYADVKLNLQSSQGTAILNEQTLEIERIQHPYAYARFIIEKHRETSFIDIRDVVESIGSSLDEALKKIKHNCDRRIRTSSVFSCRGESTKYYVLIKRFTGRGETRDTQQYPAYLFTLKPKLDPLLTEL